MGFMPVLGGGNAGQSLGPNPGTTTRGLTITADVSTNTKGAWTSMGTLTRRVGGLLVNLNTANGVSRNFSVDVGIGAGGSEVIIAADLYYAATLIPDTNAAYWLPIELPASTELFARAQSTVSSATLDVSFNFISSGLHDKVYTGADTLNFTAASTALGLITRPAGNNVKGAWTELTASSARRYRGLQFAFGPSGGSTQWRLIDIGIGAAASEQVLIPNTWWNQNTGTDAMCPQAGVPFWEVDIPAGTRIAMRLQQDVIGGGRDLLAGLVALY